MYISGLINNKEIKYQIAKIVNNNEIAMDF